jgi:hypothetical protein
MRRHAFAFGPGRMRVGSRIHADRFASGGQKFAYVRVCSHPGENIFSGTTERNDPACGPWQWSRHPARRHLGILYNIMDTQPEPAIP